MGPGHLAMETDQLPLDPIRAELMLINVMSAIEVKTRPHFFSWVQGIFQRMLPHEVLICGLAYPYASELKFEWLGSFPIAEPRWQQLCRPDGGLLHALVRIWHQNAHETLLLNDGPTPGSPPEMTQTLGQIRALDLGNGLVDGFTDPHGQPCSFFVFLKTAPPDARMAQMLHIWLPYLYASWLRAVCGEVGPPSAAGGRIRGVLTAREVEILNWVRKGKTNAQVAQILSIAETTVATHLERIFRKLDVRSRAQAVAKSMTLNLQQGRGPGWRYY